MRVRGTPSLQLKAFFFVNKWRDSALHLPDLFATARHSMVRVGAEIGALKLGGAEGSPGAGAKDAQIAD